MKMFTRLEPSESERREPRPGDELVIAARVVMDRAFTVPGRPEQVWPWLAQLGKRRAGWYLGRRVERFIPPRRRGSTTLDPRWQNLRVGDLVPDYGGRDATFTVAQVEPPSTLVYTSQRGATHLSWSIVLRLIDGPNAGGSRSPQTRVLLRLRLGPVKHVRLAEQAGGLIDLITIAGLATGLRERLASTDGEHS
jgi:hypothetical protein